MRVDSLDPSVTPACPSSSSSCERTRKRFVGKPDYPTNPDGFAANVSAWIKALSSAAQAGLLPSGSQASSPDSFVLHFGEELVNALQTQEHGRPLAVGAAIDEAVRKKDLVPLKDFLGTKQSVYTKKSWIPTAWAVGSWVLQKVGVLGSEAAEERLVKGDFVLLGNVETAAEAIIDQASRMATSNTSRIFSKELFVSTFAKAMSDRKVGATDLSVLLTHLSRDRSLIAYDAKTGTIKFKSAAEDSPTAIGEEDINIASLRTLIASLEPQVAQITNRIAELDSTARKSIATKQTTHAKSVLRSKKLAEMTLQQRVSTLMQLEEVYAKIEQAADQVEMVRIMEASTITLRNLNKQTGGVEKVQDVMEDLRAEMMNTDEITTAINENTENAFDEGELDDELEAMEKAERGKQEEKERMERLALESKERANNEQRESEEAERTKARLAELAEPTKTAIDNTPMVDRTKPAAETT
nr:uncharacterized protein CFP56_11965 [Quercus suber]